MSDTSFELPPALAIDTGLDLQRWLAELIPELSPNDTLTLDANAVSRLTTPGLQLLCSLEKNLSGRQVKLRVTNSLPAFADACAALGFSSFYQRWSDAYENPNG